MQININCKHEELKQLAHATQPNSIPVQETQQYPRHQTYQTAHQFALPIVVVGNDQIVVWTLPQKVPFPRG